MSTDTQNALHIIKQAVAQLPLSKWEDREIIRNAVVHVEQEINRLLPLSVPTPPVGQASPVK